MEHGRAIEISRGDGLLDQLLDDDLANRRMADVGFMLRRDHHRGDLLRTPIDVTHGDLALSVGAQEIDLLLLAQFGDVFHQPMRERDRQRHLLGGLVASEAEHQALVAGALLLMQSLAFGDTLRDIGGLRLDRHQHRAGLGIEAGLDIVVADVPGSLARDAYEIGMGAAGNFAGQHDEAGFGQRLEGNSGVGVFGNQRIENCIRNLIAHLVGMAFGDRLRREEKILKRHSLGLLGLLVSVMATAAAASPRLESNVTNLVLGLIRHLRKAPRAYVTCTRGAP